MSADKSRPPIYPGFGGLAYWHDSRGTIETRAAGLLDALKKNSMKPLALKERRLFKRENGE